jgi:hypothetical protein
VHGHKQVEKYICFERVHTIDSPLKSSYFSLPRNLVPELVMPAFGQGKFVRAYGRQTGHIVKRGLDWTGKTRTGLRLVKRGLDSISKTRTGLY